MLPDEFVLVASAAHRKVFAVKDISLPHALTHVPIEDSPLAAAYSKQTGYLYWVTQMYNNIDDALPVTAIRRVNILDTDASPVETIKIIDSKPYICESKIMLFYSTMTNYTFVLFRISSQSCCI